MPFSYEIDAERRLVTSLLWGSVSEDDINEHRQQLRTDPQFNPGYRQLTDMSGVTEILVGTKLVVETARDQFFAPGVPRALVACEDGIFGMSRMYAAHAEGLGQTIRVFRERSEAEAWLGV